MFSVICVRSKDNSKIHITQRRSTVRLLHLPAVFSERNCLSLVAKAFRLCYRATLGSKPRRLSNLISSTPGGHISICIRSSQRDHIRVLDRDGKSISVSTSRVLLQKSLCRNPEMYFLHRNGETYERTQTYENGKSPRLVTFFFFLLVGLSFQRLKCIFHFVFALKQNEFHYSRLEINAILSRY